VEGSLSAVVSGVGHRQGQRVRLNSVLTLRKALRFQYKDKSVRNI
jgi:hypothetical protein